VEHRNPAARARLNTDVEVPTPLARARETLTESYYLLVLSGAEIGRRCPLSRGLNAIGRGEDCEITISDESVSRKHMQIEWEDENVWVSDLSSTNGTVINGKEVSRRSIREGDVLRVGDISLRFNRGSLHKTPDLSMLYSLCAHDPLTGTFTSHHYKVVKEREACRSRRFETPLSELRLQLNITGGHVTQDECMWTIGRLLSSTSRHEDVIGKTNENEFSVLLPHTGPESGLAALRRIDQLLQESLPSHMEHVEICFDVTDVTATTQRNAS